ncbi:hypothetical protein GLAREA_08696 [Glarea lozoyensis ATCC 20868]|uniref:Heterokaryon incompatibility domain-containing protein n=1 Tax=Glarea lozoyensis (strain ATCC 20868 / MF5171) TaxID=1116229 RepID=S3EE35_GLAL2|nr:uncharacterized protein GLAREA_08696 [Glarea lozoyensis ATCC 20868]EPE36533.1 hypothetical protein GLAREA_08696 [Glarea lozoyensis ATCC 20868]
MVDTNNIEAELQAFQEHFDSIRLGLGVAESHDSVLDVFAVVDVMIAKSLIIDLVRILTIQSQPSALTISSQNENANYLSDLFSLGSNVLTDTFDFKMTITLIQQVLNNGSEDGIRYTASKLAAQARLQLASSASSPKNLSSTQLFNSEQLIEPNSSMNCDETESPPSKRVKVAHGVALQENESFGIGQNQETGTPHGDDYHQPVVEPSSPFQYQPLDTSRREIRLLILHPYKNTLNLNGYSCTLIAVSLDEDPVYEALSYVWGSTVNKKEIFIDGQHFFITSNLAEALDHLYDREKPRRLWVDAVCINQEDVSERSQQVQCMTEIFAKAKKVVVWIGLLGMKIKKLLHRIKKTEEDDQKSKSLKGRTIRGTTVTANSAPLKDEEMKLMNELALNPWFRRIWVIQEVAVAREATVQTGRTTISWSAFCTTLEKCSSKHEMKSVIEAVSMINTIRTTRFQKPYYMDLFVLLERFRHCLATDERDKVFALLGLTSSSSRQERGLQVKADYSVPAFDVFTSLARHYINRRKNLDIICHIGDANLSSHIPIPSWAPSWSWYDSGLSVLPKRRIQGALAEPMYRCCGDMELDREVLFSSELYDKTLWLNGFKFDVVSAIGGVTTKAEDLHLDIPATRVSDVLKDWRDLTGSLSCKSLYGSNISEDFQRTLLADTFGETRYPTKPPGVISKTVGEASHSQTMYDVFNSSHLYKREYADVEESSESDERPRDGFFKDVSLIESWHVSGDKSQASVEPTMYEFFNYTSLIEGGHIEGEESLIPLSDRLNARVNILGASLRRAALKRAFFVTEKGYMGLGPASIQKGDFVYVLAGGQVPFILRKHTNAETYFLMGESYVHGIMDGEAARFGFELETLCLV